MIICGIDEAGRGPWAGPVVAAAVILPCDHTPSWLDAIADSKKLRPAQRDALYDAIIADCAFGVGMADVAEIDTLNILQATMLAMQRAVAALHVTPDRALVDGNRAPTLRMATETIIGGDGKIKAIGAASIVAKVTRDRMMVALDRDYPHYGWATNAGYGTATHQQGLAAHGVTIHHRRSFAPIRALLQQAA